MRKQKRSFVLHNFKDFSLALGFGFPTVNNKGFLVGDFLYKDNKSSFDIKR